jgi:hypothetical protein
MFTIKDSKQKALMTPCLAKEPKVAFEPSHISELGIKFITQGAISFCKSSELLPKVMKLELKPTLSLSVKDKAGSLEELFKKISGLDLSVFGKDSLEVFYRLVNSTLIDASALVLNDIFVMRTSLMLEDVVTSLVMPEKEPIDKEAILSTWYDINSLFQISLSEFSTEVNFELMDKETEQLLATVIKQYIEATVDFFKALDFLIEKSLKLKAQQGPARFKLAKQFVSKKREELDLFHRFFIACIQPRVADKLINDTPLTSFMGFTPKSRPKTTDEMLEVIQDLINYTNIKEFKQNFFVTHYKIPKDAYVKIAIFKRRLEKLKEEKSFLILQEGVKKLRLHLLDVCREHARKLFKLRREGFYKRSDFLDPISYYYALACCELYCFCNDVIKMLEATIDFKEQFLLRVNLSNRILLVSEALFNNMYAIMRDIRFEDLTKVDKEIDKTIIISCIDLTKSNFLMVMKELEQQTKIIPYASSPANYEVLFEQILECISPIKDRSLEAVLSGIEKGEVIQFDERIKIAGWFSCLLLLEHDIQVLLKDNPKLEIVDILKPIHFLFDFDEESDQEESSSCGASDETERDALSLQLEEQDLDDELGLDQKLGEVSLDHIARTSTTQSVQSTLDEKELQRKKQRKKHIDLSVARKQKGRKFLQAVSELCGVDLAFTTARVKGSHKTVEAVVDERSIKLTFSSHNGADQQKLGTRQGFIKAAKAFSDQFCSS